MPYCPSCNKLIGYVQMVAKKCMNCLHEFEIYHVMPVNDLEEHKQDYTCKCEPKIKNEGENMIVIHNSFDGREGIEWANEILNK